MTLRRSSARVAIGLIASLALSAPAGAQDAIARAKNLYQSANYDEALSVLDQLKAQLKDQPAADSAAGALPEIAAYRVFCLLALGRADEAHQGIGAILREDPRYRPSESETSPRIRAVFEEDRRRLLPQIFQERYERAKATFERKEFQSAADQFKALMSLIDDPVMAGEESRSDLRMVISGFSDLAQAAVGTQAAVGAPAAAGSPTPARAAATPSPAPVLQMAAAAAPAELLHIFNASDADVVPPVAVSKKPMTWVPPRTGALRGDLSGLLELIIDENGNVVSAKLQKPVYPGFDANVIQAAKEWKYQPALRQGVPVSYRILAEVKLTR